MARCRTILYPVSSCRNPECGPRRRPRWPNDPACQGKTCELAAAGTPIGPYDVLIAGQAVARGLTLIRITPENSSGSRTCVSRTGKFSGCLNPAPPYAL